MADLDVLRKFKQTIRQEPQVQTIVESVKEAARNQVLNGSAPQNAAIRQSACDMALHLAESKKHLKPIVVAEALGKKSGIDTNIMFKHVIDVMSRDGVNINGEGGVGVSHCILEDGFQRPRHSNGRLKKTAIESITTHGVHLICTSRMSPGGNAVVENHWNELTVYYVSVHQELFEAFSKAIDTIYPQIGLMSQYRAVNNTLRNERVQNLSEIGVQPTAHFGGKGGMSAHIDKLNLNAICNDDVKGTYKLVHNRARPLKGGFGQNMSAVGQAAQLLLNTRHSVIERNAKRRLEEDPVYTPKQAKRAVLNGVKENCEEFKPLLKMSDDPIENARIYFSPVTTNDNGGVIHPPAQLLEI